MSGAKLVEDEHQGWGRDVDPASPCKERKSRMHVPLCIRASLAKAQLVSVATPAVTHARSHTFSQPQLIAAHRAARTNARAI